MLSQNEPSENKVDDQQFTSDYEKEIVAIQTMLEQGLTVEKIAQKLNKGHTEIELLIKFSPKLRKVMEEN